MSNIKNLFGRCDKNGEYIRFFNDPINPDFRNQSKIQDIVSRRPLMSECAKIGREQLTSATSALTEQNTFWDNNNLQNVHEHIFFPSTEQNIGFFPNKEGNFLSRLWDKISSRGSLESKQPEQLVNYTYDETCYDGQAMRSAISQVTETPDYNLFKFNCQDFVSMVKEKYNNIINGK
jgi:hypothetical protein